MWLKLICLFSSFGIHDANAISSYLLRELSVFGKSNQKELSKLVNQITDYAGCAKIASTLATCNLCKPTKFFPVCVTKYHHRDCDLTKPSLPLLLAWRPSLASGWFPTTPLIRFLFSIWFLGLWNFRKLTFFCFLDDLDVHLGKNPQLKELIVQLFEKRAKALESQNKIHAGLSEENAKLKVKQNPILSLPLSHLPDLLLASSAPVHKGDTPTVRPRNLILCELCAQ